MILHKTIITENYMENTNTNNNLNKNSKCSHCLWGDKCQSKVTQEEIDYGYECEDYYSIDIDEEDDILIAEYNTVLKERYEYDCENDFNNDEYPESYYKNRERRTKNKGVFKIC